MTRRLAVLALALAMAGAPITAWAFTFAYSSGTAGIAITQANTNTAITDNHSAGTAAPFKATWIVVKNRGANPVYVDMLDGVATTADIRVDSGQTMVIPWAGSAGGGYTNVGIIADTGLTATVDLQAFR